MALQFSRSCLVLSLGAAALSTSILLSGCGASRLLYTGTNLQAIRRDTIKTSGMVSFLQNPQDSANGIIRLAPVESLDLQPVTLEVSGTPGSPFDQARTLMLPSGYKASLYAYDLGRPRDLALRDDGTLFYSDFDGSIYALAPSGTKTAIVTGLSSPHGIELHNGALYYTDEHNIFRFDFSSPTSMTGSSTKLSSALPGGGTNYTRTIRWSPSDKRFYISVGSTSNNGVEDDKAHATVLRMAEKGGTLDGVTLGGLRNTVAMDFNPETGDLWGIDNGTEQIGDILPPEEVNVIKLNKHYGWPYFYAEGFRDPRYKDAGDAPTNAVKPIIDLEGHSEALDMVFYPGSALGADFHNAMLITYHNNPKVIRLRANADGSNARQADFITGFADQQGHVWGRPVGIVISQDGRTIYLSDDRAGAIYKISKL
ncbi:MAG: Glucose/sorbosone dehydrogenase [Chlorobi bacterium]|nr:Glucose/sorbosone dehydrogenase [Chlorobiota bacterium]